MRIATHGRIEPSHENLSLLNDSVDMIGQWISCLILSISEHVHAVKEERVTQWSSFDCISLVEGQEVLLLAQLIDLEVFRPPLSLFLPQWKLYGGQHDIGSFHVKDRADHVFDAHAIAAIDISECLCGCWRHASLSDSLLHKRLKGTAMVN